MAPRRKCPVCGSKQWHKEPSSGLITCSEGHVLQNYRSETTEVNELGPHAVRKRTLKSDRKKKGRPSRADPKLYHGERARYHYFQCLQLVLRMQVTALTRLWELPPEFETICRDVWALHLSLLTRPPTAEPLLHSQDVSGADRPTQAEDLAEDRNSDAHHTDHTSGSDGESSPPSSSDSDSEESEEDSELERLMRENSESPSSEDEAPEKSRKDRAAVHTKKKRTFGYNDVPATTLSVLVVACWTLRLPVVYMDFVRLIESYDLPYLDTLRLLPADMTRHLRPQTARALSPSHAPSPLRVHLLSSRLAKLLYANYDIYTPEMNAAPVLWRAVQSLQGSPTLYVMTKKLGRLVSIPLTLHRTLAPALVRTTKRDTTFHKSDSAVPEVALLAAVIVVFKMVYGLDGKPRQPKEDIDPACALPVLSELIRAIQDAEEAEAKRAPVFSLETNQSALDMDDEMLDDYLAFCEKALLPREDRMPARNITTDQFPLRRGSAPSSRTPQDQPNEAPEHHIEEQNDRYQYTANEVHLGTEILGPGEQYAIYNTQDILGTLPRDMEIVISRAAKWAGVEEGYVAGVVERFERRVVRWWKREREKISSTAEQ